MAHSFTSIRIRYGLRRGLQTVLYGSISYGIFLTSELTCSFPDSGFLLVCWRAFPFGNFSEDFFNRVLLRNDLSFLFSTKFPKANVSTSIPIGCVFGVSLTVCWAAILYSNLFGEHFESLAFFEGIFNGIWCGSKSGINSSIYFLRAFF